MPVNPLTKTLSEGPDGKPRWNYSDAEHVMLTGPVAGPVRTADGSIYDLTDDVIAIDPDHAGELNHHVALKHEELSRTLGERAPLGPNYRHDCTPECQPSTPS